ncbi:uncharacterized protein LOC143618200 [Bidens hawaiensis]|uniref:uncharacterized protein LOC143618200 n=1 Tax=Bidens hawaiensis TaxID=980011 RepID=UPI00404A029C
MVIEGIHGSSNDWGLVPINKKILGIWKNIASAIKDLKNNGESLDKCFVSKIGDGKSIKFWLDTWNECGPLKLLFPLLFSLEKKKHCTVFERVRNVGNWIEWSWNWRRDPRSAEEVLEWEKMFGLFSPILGSNGPDKWIWRGVKGDEFSVADARRIIGKDIEPNSGSMIGWVKWIPKKCLVFMWREVMNRIPTRTELMKKGTG